VLLNAGNGYCSGLLQASAKSLFCHGLLLTAAAEQRMDAVWLLLHARILAHAIDGLLPIVAATAAALFLLMSST
jgi:hypothetical protein